MLVSTGSASSTRSPGTKPCLDADIPGARIDEAVVTFRGLCAACARAKSRNP